MIGMQERNALMQHRLPPDASKSKINFPIVFKLKIASLLVRDVRFGPGDSAIPGAIILMAKSLRLKGIAQAVENTGQSGFLKTPGCGQYQGNLLRKPLLSLEMPGFVSASGRSV